MINFRIGLSILTYQLKIGINIDKALVKQEKIDDILKELVRNLFYLEYLPNNYSRKSKFFK